MPLYKLNVNGTEVEVEAQADTPLLWVLRDNLQLTGTKYGCGIALCGTCTVHLNGKAIRSCVTSVSGLEDSEITTIEGLAGKKLHPVQQAWMEEDVPQCGFCQTGQIMTAAALLKENPDPTDEEINKAMAGNLCRCGTYVRIRKAIKNAASK